MIVHDVKVHQIRAGGDDGTHLLAQTREVGRQDAGSDTKAARLTQL